MAHELATVNGKAAMFSGMGIVPWHGLGTVVDGLLDSEQAIIAAGLNYLIRAEAITVRGTEISTDRYQAIIRDDTGEVLSVMRGGYEIIQNSQAFKFMDSLAGEGSIKYETAGALRNGALVWIMARIPGEMEINGDAHQQWLLLITSHDGSRCLELRWVTVRVVCANTLALAISTSDRNGKAPINSVKIRHTQNWEAAKDEARRVLGLTEVYFASLKAQLEGMNEQMLTPEQMAEFSIAMAPGDDAAKLSTRTSNIRAELNRLFEKGAGNHGTSRWDALQAVSDYADHLQPLRGKASTRMESALMGTAAAMKQKAFELLTAEDLMQELFQKAAVRARESVLSPGNTTSDDFARLIGSN